MKKSILLKMSVLSLFCVIAGMSWAQTEATATWVFDQGTEGQVATYSPDGVSKYFKTSYVTLGSGLYYYVP
ncbi:MAG: hypothetical protein LUC88_03065, partial [Prevotella sp.]|nr:hypothetical protein [Prevotella sp.]